jgi:hypothetical protein
MPLFWTRPGKAWWLTELHEYSAACFKQLTPPLLSLKKTCFWIHLIYLRSISLSVSFIPFCSSTGDVLETLEVRRTLQITMSVLTDMLWAIWYSSSLVPRHYSFRLLSSNDSVPCFLPLKLFIATGFSGLNFNLRSAYWLRSFHY